MLLIDMEKNSSTAYWATMTQQPVNNCGMSSNKEIQQVMTDFWKPYEHFVPSDIHIQSKAETYTVEGYNSLFCHFFASLRRKTKCYSKSKKMLLCSVILLMLKWNDGLSAIKLTMPNFWGIVLNAVIDMFVTRVFRSLKTAYGQGQVVLVVRALNRSSKILI